MGPNCLRSAASGEREVALAVAVEVSREQLGAGRGRPARHVRDAVVRDAVLAVPPRERDRTRRPADIPRPTRPPT